MNVIPIRFPDIFNGFTLMNNHKGFFKRVHKIIIEFSLKKIQNIHAKIFLYLFVSSLIITVFIEYLHENAFQIHIINV